MLNYLISAYLDLQLVMDQKDEFFIIAFLIDQVGKYQALIDGWKLSTQLKTNWKSKR